MFLPPNSTDVSLEVLLVDDFGYPVTGRDAATFPPVTISRATGADVSLALVDLATLATAHTDGGLKERGEGRYRLDLPDAQIAAVGIVRLRAETAGARLIAPPIQIAKFANGLAESVPGDYAAGTAGYRLGTEPAAILARLVRVARTATALADDGTLKLIRGDTHEAWINPVVSWDITTASDLATAVATLTVKIGTSKHATTGTLAQIDADTWRATFSPQIPDTFPTGKGTYDAQIALADDSKIATIALGPSIVVPDVTRPAA